MDNEGVVHADLGLGVAIVCNVSVFCLLAVMQSRGPLS